MKNQEAVKALVERRSVRDYKRNEQISEAELDTIVKIITDAPTHHNTQLLYFTVVQDKALLAELSEKIRLIMLEGTPAQREKASTPGYSPLHYAPTVIFVSGDMKADWYVQTECGIAAGQIVSAASVMGLASCITCSSVFMFKGTEGDDIKNRLGIPENYSVACTVALGYLEGEEPARPDKTDKVNFIR